MPHICVSKLTIINSDDEMLLIGPLRINFSEISIEIHTCSFTKCNWRCSLKRGSHFVCNVLNKCQCSIPTYENHKRHIGHCYRILEYESCLVNNLREDSIIWIMFGKQLQKWTWNMKNVWQTISERILEYQSCLVNNFSKYSRIWIMSGKQFQKQFWNMNHVW